MIPKLLRSPLIDISWRGIDAYTDEAVRFERARHIPSRGVPGALADLCDAVWFYRKIAWPCLAGERSNGEMMALSCGAGMKCNHCGSKEGRP